MEKEGAGHELITELRLGLPGGGRCGSGGSDSISSTVKKVNISENKKRVFSDISDESRNINAGGCNAEDGQKIQTKTQVVGWPPVCSYRRKNSFSDKDGVETSKMYVKVSMDGAPFLRKIDLGLHKDYYDLAMALEKLFGCFGINEAMKDADNSEYVPIYEDKDGDWMLAGEIPWQMFIESCKRLRIMKRSEAKGFGLQGRRAPNKGT